MNETELTPAAEILMDAYFDTAIYSRAFRDEYGQPPTLAAKVHHLRAIAQAHFIKSDRFILEQHYCEFRRVQFVDLETGQSYLLRSTSAVAIEGAKAQREFFNANVFLESAVKMLVYSFGKDGLDLSITGTRQRANRRRLEASGSPRFIATWPYAPGDGEPFEQGDPFGDLGDLGWDEGDEGSEESGG